MFCRKLFLPVLSMMTISIGACASGSAQTIESDRDVSGVQIGDRYFLSVTIWGSRRASQADVATRKFQGALEELAHNGWALNEESVRIDGGVVHAWITASLYRAEAASDSTSN